MKELNGIAASPGLAAGRAFRFGDEEALKIPHYAIAPEQFDAEWGRLLQAFNAAIQQLEQLKDSEGIFEAHIFMLEDPEFLSRLQMRMHTGLENAEWVLSEESSSLIKMMKALPDASLRERADDIADVTKRVLNILLPGDKVSLAELDADVILLAKDVLPSDLLSMKKERVKAIVTDSGSRTSHTAILARAFDIPAVLGCHGETGPASAEIKDGDMLLVNGSEGRVTVNPGDELIAAYQNEQGRYQKLVAAALEERQLPAVTKDGFELRLMANIGVSDEAVQALRYGADGVGLFRSEFLFLNSDLANDEEHQTEAYRSVVKTMGGLPVTIRTLDAGGDKIIPSFNAGEEKNPLLGWRAVRFCLASPDIFKTQLRAILRASADGPVRIMFPLISGLGELREAKACLETAKVELRKEGIPFNETIPVGVMIETPSAAIIADLLAAESAFFSIGTNDLVQYTLAVDRGNERVSYLAQPFHPAVLRLIKKTIDAAQEAGIEVTMCGEMAGDAASTALLLGLGLGTFSMTASSLPFVRQIIRSVSINGEGPSCRRLANAALECKTPEETAALVSNWMEQM
jgi:phosphotransferase system enzyme I (PtsI)